MSFGNVDCVYLIRCILSKIFVGIFILHKDNFLQRRLGVQRNDDDRLNCCLSLVSCRGEKFLRVELTRQPPLRTVC